MQIIYRADDGREFSVKSECTKYENMSPIDRICNNSAFISTDEYENECIRVYDIEDFLRENKNEIYKILEKLK